MVYKDRRDQLTPYVGQEVEAKGVFRRMDLRVHGTRTNRTALVERLFVTVDGKTLDIDHVWVQYADAIKALDPRPGEKVKFRATVGTYTKEKPTEDGQGIKRVQTYNLSNPEAVACPDREPLAPDHDEVAQDQPPPAAAPPAPAPAPAPAPPPTIEPAPASSPTDLVRTLMRLAAVWGWDEVCGMVEVLAK
jgi:hypothetical protein